MEHNAPWHAVLQYQEEGDIRTVVLPAAQLHLIYYTKDKVCSTYQSGRIQHTLQSMAAITVFANKKMLLLLQLNN